MEDWVHSLGSYFLGGGSRMSLQFEGLSAGWALILILILTVATIWSYRLEKEITERRRIVLTTLRTLLLAGVVIFLTQPVLLIAFASTVRGELLVLLDASASMQLKDVRTSKEDLKRVVMAGANGEPTRWEMVKAVGANKNLALWTRLHEKSDLVFFSLGRDTHEIGRIGTGEKDAAASGESILSGVTANEPATALGSGLKEVIDPRKGRKLAGVFLVTDGANNSGFSPVEAAQMAGQNGCPLFIYGVGITDPLDTAISSVEGPAIVSVKEKTLFKARVKGVGKEGGRVILRANGKQIDEESVKFAEDGESEVDLEFEPGQTGSYALEASIAPLPNESFKENNKSIIHVRVVDEPLKVLLVEQEPRWDFQYLSSMLERDRRIKPKVVLLDGDPGLDAGADSIFLSRLPEDRAALFGYQVIILGDVDPARLGSGWMKLLAQWVAESGGALIFHAGPRFDPKAYNQTPLAPLLPVESLPVNLRSGGRSRLSEPVPLRLTAAGQSLPMLGLSNRPEENEVLWKKFPGVRWAAPVRAKLSARVFLTWGSRDTPVIAYQEYGAGHTLFIGTDETYFWRSKMGEKYYTRLWGQMLESMARSEGGSGTTRLRVDYARPAEGESVMVSGRIFRPGYETLMESSVPGLLSFTSEEGGEVQKTELTLQAIPDRPGEFRAPVKAGPPGIYRYSIRRDPKTEVEWYVSAANQELSDIAMNQKLLEAMAEASGGNFLREEDLSGLPEKIAVSSAAQGEETFKRVELGFSPWLMAVLLLLAIGEWIFRRMSQLK